MRVFLSLLFAGLALIAQESKIDDKKSSSTHLPKPFVALPTNGFASVADMETFAAHSLHGGGSVEEMTIKGKPVWVMSRSVMLGGSTSEITFLKNVHGKYLAFLAMPITYGEFRVSQNPAGLTVNRFDYSEKRWVDVLAVHSIP